MIIVSGTIYVQSGTREKFLNLSSEAIELARRTEGCRDFVVAEDPLEADRVNVYEAWDSVEVLLTFRGDGAGDDLTQHIVRSDIHEYQAVPHEV